MCLGSDNGGRRPDQILKVNKKWAESGPAGSGDLLNLSKDWMAVSVGKVPGNPRSTRLVPVNFWQ